MKTAPKKCAVDSQAKRNLIHKSGCGNKASIM